MATFADCSTNIAPLTPAQICNGFTACDASGVPMNSAGLNAALQYLEDLAVASVPAPDGSETKVTAGANVTVTGTGTVATPYVVSAAAGGAGDGSETKVTAASGVTVTGTGTIAIPYVVGIDAAALSATLCGTPAFEECIAQKVLEAFSVAAGELTIASGTNGTGTFTFTPCP